MATFPLFEQPTMRHDTLNNNKHSPRLPANWTRFSFVYQFLLMTGISFSIYLR